MKWLIALFAGLGVIVAVNFLAFQPVPVPQPPVVVEPELLVTSRLSRVSNSNRQFYFIATRNVGIWTLESDYSIALTKARVVSANGFGTKELSILIESSSSTSAVLNLDFRYKDFTLSHQPVMLSYLDPSLGQPELVKGLANTKGHEDGSSISPDGNWLVLHYLPISFSCYIQGGALANNPNCQNNVGPVSAPQRPDLPGQSRIVDGKTINHCPRLNRSLGTSAFPISAYYMFRRNDKNEFVEPREVGFKNGDGCFFPFGPTLTQDSSGKMFSYIAWSNFFEGHNTQSDLHGMALNFDLPGGLNYAIMNLATPMRPEQMNLKRLGPVLPQNLGNPHVVESSLGVPSQVFWDDENAPENDRRIGFSNLVNNNWTAARYLPAGIFNFNFGGAIQPYLEDGVMLWRLGHTIASATYMGGPMDQISSWSNQRVLMSANGSLLAGEVFTLGEPSITRKSMSEKHEIFFTVGKTDDDGIINFDVGVVEVLHSL